ncbi:MAG: hypothetical protein ACRCYS_00890, partial [Beijerinckiaceae bacterium]
MTRHSVRLAISPLLSGALVLALTAAAAAQTAQRARTSTAGLDSFGGGDKQPINIEADKLD